MKTKNQAAQMIRKWNLGVITMGNPNGQVVKMSLADRRSGVRGGRYLHVRTWTMNYNDAAALYADGVLKLHKAYER